MKFIYISIFLLVFSVVFCNSSFFKKAETISSAEVALEQTKTIRPSLDTHVVEISGAVKKPGVYLIPASSRVNDLLKLAEGFATTADIVWVSKNLSLAATTNDSEKIYIPFLWDSFQLDHGTNSAPSNVKEFYVTTKGVESSSVSPMGKSTTGNAKPVSSLNNINSCTKDVLLALDGVGEVYASKIIENRPFKNIEDLRAKIKLPQKVVDEINTNLTF